MKIEQVAVVLPSRSVTNEEILEMIAKETGPAQFSGNLKTTLSLVRRMLRSSGSVTRLWRESGESSISLTIEACKKALTGLPEGDNKIDLLISASVYRELVEPAGANLIAHALGLDDARCFDLIEACDGWMVAAELANLYIKSGRYRRVMVVNGEFVMTRGFGIYPELFRLSSPKELEWRFPAFTLGEAATATIFGPGPENGSRWSFTNTPKNEHYDLCSITQPWHRTHSILSSRVAKDGPGLFTSYGIDLRRYGFPLAVEEFRKSGVEPANVDALFTHSSSKKDWSEVAEVIGLSNVFHDVYEEYGNVVSAAIPTAMALGVENGTLKRGDRVLALVASAGMSFSTAAFTF